MTGNKFKMIYEGVVMSDLFIIGNGFDRAHGMETSYYNFHQFIKDNCKNMPYTGSCRTVISR